MARIEPKESNQTPTLRMPVFTPSGIYEGEGPTPTRRTRVVPLGGSFLVRTSVFASPEFSYRYLAGAGETLVLRDSSPARGGLLGALRGAFTSSDVVKVTPDRSKRAPAATASDVEWFYADPDRISRYAGNFVALRNRQIVAYGTASEVSRSGSGAIVFYVETPEERAQFDLGL